MQVRRLHDINRSGWWIGGFYLALIPAAVLFAFLVTATESGSGNARNILVLLGTTAAVCLLGYVITMFVFLVKRGDGGPNRFG